MCNCKIAYNRETSFYDVFSLPCIDIEIGDELYCVYGLVGLTIKFDISTIMYEDNKSCIDMVHSRSRHQASKHINPKYHLVRAKQQHKVIDVTHISTLEQLADIFTKPLPITQHQYFTDSILNRS